MEPLSVSASIVGLLTAAAAVTTLIRNVREAPTIAQDVASEAIGITACLNQLRLFLAGTVTASTSRTSLIMIDQILVVLTNSVKTFSELQEILEELKQDQQKRIFNALRWARKEQKISKLLLRLQASKVSLNLMLTTLNCVSLDEARGFSEKLRDLVSEALENDETMAQRIDEMETQMIRPSIRGSIGTMTIRGDAESQSTPVVANNSSTTKASQTQSIAFAFENDLQSSRVYGRVTHKHSYISLTSSAGKSRGWSFLSDLTLSEVSNVSVLFLPITKEELYNGYDYQFSHARGTEAHGRNSYRTCPSSSEGDHRRRRLLLTFTEIGKGIPPQDSLPPSAIVVETTVTVRSIDATEGAITWPPSKVAAWMGRTSIQRSILHQFLTDDMSGFSTMFMRPRNLIQMGITDFSEQACLWAEVQQLNNFIFNELFDNQTTSRRLIAPPWPLPDEPLPCPLPDPLNSDDLSPPPALDDRKEISNPGYISVDPFRSSLMAYKNGSRSSQQSDELLVS